ncbi:MAG: hypothetical protein ACMZ63_08000 [Methylotenera sp.]
MSFNPQLADSDGKMHFPSNWPNKFVSEDAGRFVARYRIAKAAKVDFDGGISEKIGCAYSAFIKLFLAYSAFEAFQKTFSLSSSDIDKLDQKYGGDQVVLSLKTLHNSSPKFFRFIQSHLNSGPAKKNISNFINGNAVTAISLAKSFRHIFAHGVLTPSSDGSESNTTKKIGLTLYNHLMHIMDAEAASMAQQKC